MKNLFYFRKIMAIGGTEQFLYEIAKKYNAYDITIYYDYGDPNQIERLRRYVRCRKRVKGEKVVCEKAFFNFNIDMIEDVEAKEYYFVAHAAYQAIGYKPPIEHPKLTHYIGVSKFSADSIEEYGKVLGKEIKAITCYNPLTLEKDKPALTLVSACRLDDVVKGGGRTLELIKALDQYCLENNRTYTWHIFTNPTDVGIESTNVFIRKPTVNVRPFIKSADYVLQLSNDMETYCYTINEALGYGVPIVTTPLSVVKELPIDENMRIELKYDCSNVQEVAKAIFEKEVKPFKYTPPEPIWETILEKGESTYKEELMKDYKVEAILKYFDLELKRNIEVGEVITVKGNRREKLLDLNLVKDYEEPKKAQKEAPRHKYKNIGE